jgi:cytochrome b561
MDLPAPLLSRLQFAFQEPRVRVCVSEGTTPASLNVGPTVPSWTGRDDALLALAQVAHGEVVTNLLLALIAGHALAALWHQASSP